MSEQVVTGAQMSCSFGASPAILVVLPKGPPVMDGGVPAATIMDFVPGLNILPFGMCKAPLNPAVIAATAAAMGTLTPMPCMPVTVAPWLKGSTKVMINAFPSLNSGSQCMCVYGGKITFNSPGQTSVTVK